MAWSYLERCLASGDPIIPWDHDKLRTYAKEPWPMRANNMNIDVATQEGTVEAPSFPEPMPSFPLPWTVGEQNATSITIRAVDGQVAQIKRGPMGYPGALGHWVVEMANRYHGTRSALVSMIEQFAYVRAGKITAGGLSALEEAFEALGWEDPRTAPDHLLCCVEPGCGERCVVGTKTHGGCRSVCSKHMPQENERLKGQAVESVNADEKTGKLLIQPEHVTDDIDGYPTDPIGDQ